MVPGFFAFEVFDGVVELGLEALLPGGIEGGVDVEAAELGGFGVIEELLEFAADCTQGVGGLGFALFVIDEADGFGRDGVAAFLVDDAHGAHAVEGLGALLESGVEIAEG